MRRAAKKDDNHAEIVGTLKGLGFSVLETYQLGEDVSDFVCAFRGETAVVEVKSGKGKLTGGQIKFKQLWMGKHIVARTYYDVLAAFGVKIDNNKDVVPNCPHCKNDSKVGKFWVCERCGERW